MGIISTAKVNIQDIFQGTKAVVTGKPTSPYIREQERLSKEAEAIARRKQPDVDPRTIHTPVTDPSGRPIYHSPFTGTTSGALKVQEIKRQEAIQKRIEAQRQAEIARLAKIEADRIAKIESGRRATQAEIKRQEQITERRSGPSIDAAQQRYIASLKTKTTPTITGYTGIQLPYGQKDVRWQEPAFGTVIDETKTGFRDVSLYKTLREQEVIDPDVSKPIEIIYQEKTNEVANKIIKDETEKAQKVLGNSLSKIQGRIDRGEMSVARGNEAMDMITATSNEKLQRDVGVKFDKQITTLYNSKTFKNKIKDIEKFRGTFERRFDPEAIKKRTRRKLETVADITAAVVSGVAPPVGVAYFGAKGIYKGAKGREKDVRMAEYNPITGELVTPRYMGEIPSPETREAGVSLLFGGLSGIGMAAKIGGEITALRAAELKAKPWRVVGKEVSKIGDDTVLRVSASKTIGTASAEAELILPIKVDAKGGFKILAGKGAVKTRVVDFMSQGAVARGGDIVKGSHKFTTFGRGSISDGLIKTKWGNIKVKGLGLKVTSGEGYISPNTIQNFRVETIKKRRLISYKPFTPLYKRKEVMKFDVATKAEKFLFGGVSAEGKTGTGFVSGELAKARLYPGERGVTGLFRPGAYGKVLKVSEKPAMKGFVGGGAKSSKQFFKQLYAQTPSVIPKAEVIGRQAIPSILEAGERAAISTSLKAPSIIGRTALSTLPIAGRKAMGLTIPAVGMSSTEMLKSKLGVKQAVDVGITSRSISQGLDVNPITGVKPSTDLSFTPVSITKMRTPQIPTTKQIMAKPIIGASGIIPPIPTPIGKPVAVPSAPPLIFGFERKKPQVVKAQGYHAYVLRAGPTGKKSYIKLDTPPLTQESALSAMSREVDQSISARGKIQKIQKSVQKVQKVAGALRYKRTPQVNVIDTKDKYWKKNKNKFRTYKTKKKLPLPTGVVIERQRFRLDSSREKRQIIAAKKASKRPTIGVTIRKKTKSLFGL